MKSSLTVSVDREHIDPLFDQMVEAIQKHLEKVLAEHGNYLFNVNTVDLYEEFLSNLTEDFRQHHDCHCCQHFIKNFGNLAVVNNEGRIVSALWGSDDTPDLYKKSCSAMAKAVSKGKIDTVAFKPDKIWGKSPAGGWDHFKINAPKEVVFRKVGVLNSFQVEAAKKEDYRTLMHGLGEFKLDTIKQALNIIQSEALYRNEKVLGPAKFLLETYELKSNKNLIWKQVAKAAPGFCQPRSTMIGTLLEDLEAGLSFETVKNRFASKMNPLQYQRPQAPPSAGTIAQAEKLAEEMGIGPSLQRRFARLDEIETIWKPVEESPAKPDGLFGHLKPKGAKSTPRVEMTPQAITWEKFKKTVLPDAKSIEVKMPSSTNLAALLTAVNFDAPPILQWDTEEQRNPVSWYLYNRGSTPENWNLKSNTWVKVNAVSLQPSMWFSENSHQGKSVIFILEGAKDLQYKKAGSGIFPEILKSSMHPVRSVIEAYSRTATIAGEDEASANGLIFQGNGATRDLIRVTNSLGQSVYKIDRWD